MKNSISKQLLVVIAFCMQTAVCVGQEVLPYLSDDELPNASLFIAAPPELYSAQFFNDYYYYGWGKEMRKDSERAEQAAYDNSNKKYNTITSCFEEAYGMFIDENTSPELLTLLQRVFVNIDYTYQSAKNEYKRTRPFEQFGEPSLIEEKYGNTDSAHGTYSFPSGHTLMAFTTALILSEINPAAASEIIKRARICAENRLICGHHYKSDVDASVMIAGALVAVLHSKDEFNEQMKKAKDEFIHSATNVSNLSASTHSAMYVKTIIGNKVVISNDNESYTAAGVKIR